MVEGCRDWIFGERENVRNTDILFFLLPRSDS